MTDSIFPGPDAPPARQEHPAAAPGTARRLLQSIPEDRELLTRLQRRHIVSTEHCDAALLRQLMRLAARFELGELAGTHPMRCKVLSNLFLDHSHCTGRLAFNAAWMRLGGSLLDFERTVDQIISRRYAVDEVAELCNSYSDVTVLRTADNESFQEMLPRFRVPVINAGDGVNEHPTHAMADLYMLFKWRPELLCENPPAERRLTIGIVGDPSRTRTIRSFLRVMARFPNAVERVVLMQRLEHGFSAGQREELEAAGLRVETTKELFPMATDMQIARELMPTVDLLYVHQLQAMHVPRMQVVESIALFKPDSMVLSPEMPNEEAAHLLNDSMHNGYFGQTRGSVFVRMALFTAIAG